MSYLKRKKNNSKQTLSLLAKLFIAVLLVTVFEGALRKWISNGLTYPLVALRDGLTAYGVLWGLFKGRCYKAQYFNTLLIFSLILFWWGIIQLFVNGTSPIVFILGLRFWLLYLWFAFFVGVSITDYDFTIITKLMVTLVIIMTPLVILQHFSPPLSFINRQPVAGSLIFLVMKGIVRVTSTFSFTAGYTIFLAMATPFIFISFNKGKALWDNKWVANLGLLSLLISNIVSGSRGALIFFGAFFLIYVLVIFFSSKGKEKTQSIYLLVVMAFILMLSSLVFDRAIDASQQRFETASQNEDPIDRLIYTFGTQGEITILGEGLGLGSNVAGVFSNGYRSMLLAESENARVILEVGILGVIVTLFKISLIIIASYKAYKIAMKSGDISAFLIWVAVAVALLSWSIIGQLTINSLGYLLVGLGVFAIRTKKHNA